MFIEGRIQNLLSAQIQHESASESTTNEKSSQLINQFQVASETIEGVLDVSESNVRPKNNFNATMINDQDMSVLSDSSQIESQPSSRETSNDSFQKARGLLGEYDTPVKNYKPVKTIRRYGFSCPHGR